MHADLPPIEHHCQIGSASHYQKLHDYDKYIRPYVQIIETLIEEDPIAHEAIIKSYIRYKNYLMQKYGIESSDEQDYRGDD